jgi:hypothetical protein
MYQDDNGLWDIPEPHSNMHDFLKVAAITVAGAYVGSQLDNTRFGRWFNTSPLIGLLVKLLRAVIIGLIGYYIVCVIRVW